MTADELREIAAQGRRMVVAVRWDSRDSERFPFVEIPTDALELLADMADHIEQEGGNPVLLDRLNELTAETWR